MGKLVIGTPLPYKDPNCPFCLNKVGEKLISVMIKDSYLYQQMKIHNLEHMGKIMDKEIKKKQLIDAEKLIRGEFGDFPEPTDAFDDAFVRGWIESRKSMEGNIKSGLYNYRETKHIHLGIIDDYEPTECDCDDYPNENYFAIDMPVDEWESLKKRCKK